MNKIHTCKRCGYETTQKCHLIRHLNIKKTCSSLIQDIDRSELIKELELEYKEKTYNCETCNRKFNSRSNKCRHKQTCKQRTSNQVIQIPITEYLDLKAEVEGIKEKLKHYPANITNNNTQNNNININVQVRDFASSENKKYLDKSFLLECFRDMDLMKVLGELHFNPDHPENHNIRIKNVKQNLMEYVQLGKWVVGKKDEMLEYLVMNGYRVLQTYYKDNKENVEFELEDEEINESLRWLKQIYNEDKTVLRELKNDAFLLVMNNKALLFKKD